MLRSAIPKIDFVLVSHADMDHIGALPYAVGKLGLKVPVYTTFPVYKMGQMTCYDAYQSCINAQDFDLFDLDDVDAAFAQITHLRFQQEQFIKGITIKPHAAGHTIGGAIWQVVKDTENILYAVDFNHRRERHLDPTRLAKLKRPTVLIMDAHNALYVAGKHRSKAFVDNVVSTLRRGGSVLVPTDTAGRVLELLLLLEEYWSSNRLRSYHLVLLTNVSTATRDFASRLLEWISAEKAKAFDEQRNNPFDFKYVHLCQDVESVNALGPEPKVVLTTFPSLQVGFGRSLFVEWATVPENLVLLTDRASPRSLTRDLISLVGEPKPWYVELSLAHRVKLMGEELYRYQEKLRIERLEVARKERARQEEAALRDAIGHISDSGGSDTDSEDDVGPIGASAAHGDGGGGVGAGAGVAGGAGGPGTSAAGDATMGEGAAGAGGTGRRGHGFGRFASRRYPMFAIDHRLLDRRGVRRTAYGEAISHAEFDTGIGGVSIGANDGRPGGPGGATEVKVDMSASARLKRLGEGGGDKGGDTDMGEAAVAAAEEDVPTKSVVSTMRLPVNCSVAFVDMEGRADGRAVQELLSQVAPRAVVLVHGTTAASTHLREYCEARISETVFAPQAGECVDMSSGTYTFNAKLRDVLFQSLKFQDVGQYRVAYLEGEAQMAGEDEGVLTTPAGGEATGVHEPVLLRSGPVDLQGIRKEIKKKGVSSSLQFGVLVCDGGVVVRRTTEAEAASGVGSGTGLEMEGPMCDAYYIVRDALYNQYSVV